MFESKCWVCLLVVLSNILWCHFSRLVELAAVLGGNPQLLTAAQESLG